MMQLGECHPARLGLKTDCITSKSKFFLNFVVDTSERLACVSFRTDFCLINHQKGIAVKNKVQGLTVGVLRIVVRVCIFFT